MQQAIAIRSEFAAAVALAVKVVDRRSTLPVVGNLALVESGGVLTVRGTDLDKEMTVALPGSPVDPGFAITVSAHAIRDAEKKAPDASEIEITADHSGDAPRARFGFGKLSLNMQALPFGDYAENAVEMSAPIYSDFTMSRADLLAMLDKVEFAVSDEETRYYLNGIYMHRTEAGELAFAATDGHRLALHSFPAPAGADAGMPGVIIPRGTLKTLRELCKAKGIGGSFRVEVNSVKARFTIGNVTLVTKLVDGTFPDYQRVIPRRNGQSFTANVSDMIEAIKAVSVISSERGKAFRLTIGEGTATLSVDNPDAGTASQDVAAEWTGKPGLEIGFNAAYALEILERVDGDTVTIRMDDYAGSPVLIEQAAGLFVLMPMRV